MSCIRKRAAERLDYVHDYSDWLADGDAIVAADTPVVADITSEPVIEGQRVRLWLSGGQSGASYAIKLKIITSKGRIKTETIKVRVK